MAGELFISHASEDTAIVARIVAYLETRGVPCWIASRDIPPRSIYAEAITEGIETCSACAVVVSAASNASDAVKRELELASHNKKPFIPIRIDATEPGRGLAYYLRNAQWIDYRQEGERALDRIVGRSAAPQSEPARAAPPKPADEPKVRVERPFVVGGLVAAVALTIWVLSVTQPAPTPTTDIATEVAPAATDTVLVAPASEPAADPAAAERAARVARLPSAQWVRRVRTEPIVAGQTMAGVRLGQTTEEVERILGPPTENGVYRVSDRLELIVFMDDDGGVSGLRLIDVDLRLGGLMVGARGVGIGATPREVEARLGPQTIENPDDYCISYDVQGLSFGMWNGQANMVQVFRGGPGSGCDY